MKKLNRKGFTLVELLAVIVILAIIVGIALVTMLPNIEASRKKGFDEAVTAIRLYIQNQKDMSLLSEDLRNGDNYVSAIGEATCTSESPCDGTTGNLLTLAGYDKNITEIKWYVESGIVRISCATANENGDFRQSNNYTACPTSGE